MLVTISMLLFLDSTAVALHYSRIKIINIPYTEPWSSLS